MSRKDQENLIMPKIITVLRKVGGSITRNQLIDALIEYAEDIPEEYTQSTKISKNGNEYRPFAYTFNFALKNLEFAGFVTRPIRGSVDLTEKGRTTNLQLLNVKKDIRDAADPKWAEQTKKNKLKKNIIDEDEIDSSKVDEWRRDLLKALKDFSPAKFELFSRLLIKKMGVTMDEQIGVSLSGDGGLDGFGYLTTDDFRTTRVAIQAKRWDKGLVSAPDIDKFRGAMDKYRAEYGVFITTSDFSREAVKTSREGTRAITLINGDKIADLVAKYQIHAQPVTTYILDEYYESEK